jgi:hypothetical protein
MRTQRIGGLIVLLILARSGWCRVLIHWTQPGIPPARSLGVSGVVITWGQNQSFLVKAARQQGYKVYLETTEEQAKAAAAASAQEGLAGIVVKAPGSEPVYGDAQRRQVGSTAVLIRSLRTAYRSLSIRLLEPGGKQPQMRGGLVVNRNGMLEVSSPTRQPWIDSNVTLIRFEQVYDPNEKPLIDFQWDLIDSTERRYGPPPGSYELAVAEAGAFHADLILPLHKTLQEDLTRRKPQAWKNWREIERYIQFYSRVTPAEPARLMSNAGICAGDYDSSYEAANLMARHNIPYQFIRPRELAAGTLRGLALIVVFSPLDRAAAEVVDHFSAEGGTAVLVGQHGEFPWRARAPARKNSESAVYRIGRGKMVEIAGPIVDPEPFAQDIWRLLGASHREMSLWNALTVVGAAYGGNRGAKVSLNLVNYSCEPIRVQVRLKGRFSRIRYETPEAGCCASLTAAEEDGFTEFVVPNIRIGALVHLVPVIH